MRAFCSEENHGEFIGLNTLSIAVRPVAHMTSEIYIYIYKYHYEHCSFVRYCRVAGQ